MAEPTDPHTTDGATSAVAPLFVVKDEATPEEVAALVAVLQAVVATSTAGPPAAPRSLWSANHRKVRPSFAHGPGGWRSSAMPR